MTVWDTPGTPPDPPDPARTRLRFRNARHWVHKAQWENALSPSERDRASYPLRDHAALHESDRLRIVDGDPPPPPCDGVEWFVSNGHTPGQLLPIFFDEHALLMFVGDLIPTSAHLPVPWVMAYDLFPLTAIEEKKRVLDRCRDDGLLLAFPHDRRMGGARVSFGARYPQAIPIEL
jgi:glyoxylase-like metal-dependent hydrolase (beta-lactamase superfamily II)